MAPFPNRVRLGRSGLEVGPLGVAGGYGVGARPLLRAFDRGVNYFYHGSRRGEGMRAAIRDLIAAGQRDELVIILQSYSRWPWLLERTLARGLRELGTEYADVLLLGWYNHVPSAHLLERVERLRERGLFRHLAVSGHHRSAFVRFAADPRFAILHIRYNAAHTGAETDVFPHLQAADRPGIVAYTATRWGTLLKPRRMPAGQAPLRAREAYRFVLSNRDFNVCMSGPRNEGEMEEALAALAEGPLSAAEDERVRAVGHHVRARSWAR
jgi:aryl-alcohol dehydrogenase-like predicted oxidoreductase